VGFKRNKTHRTLNMKPNKKNLVGKKEVSMNKFKKPSPFIIVRAFYAQKLFPVIFVRSF